MRFDQLIATIYAAIPDSARWGDVLIGLQAAFDGSAAALIAFSRSPGACRLVTTRPEAAEEYARNWDVRNPLHPTNRHARGFGACDVANDRMLMPREALTKTAYFNDFLVPHDMPHLLAIRLDGDKDRDITLNVMRGRGFDGFDCDALALARRLQQHLRGAVRMAGRLAWTDLTAAAAGVTLETLATGVVLLDREGTVLHCNAAARRMIETHDGLELSRGRLAAALPVDQAALTRLIGTATLAARAACHGGAIVVTRPSGRRAWAVIAAPIRAEIGWLASRPPVAILSIADPGRTPLPAADRLIALFHLTPREAAVALGVAGGGEIKDVAHSLCLTVLTARQYLSRALHKTGTERQGDLTRLLVTLGMLPT